MVYVCAVEIKAAYKTVILSEGAHKLGYANQSILNMRVKANKNQYPTEPVMRKVLKKAGWKCVQKEEWTVFFKRVL